MTGLEKILSQISSEAEASAAEALRTAQAQADAILQQAQAEADAQCAAIAAKADRAEKDAAARAESAADLQKRRAVLAAKQEIIGSAIQKAHDAVCALPDEEYFAAVQKLAVRYALPGEGTLYFNKTDAARLPAAFAAELTKALPAGSKLTVSAETRPIDGGFVLAYGGVEENCSFAALFAAQREAMQDQVQRMLFA